MPAKPTPISEDRAKKKRRTPLASPTIAAKTGLAGSFSLDPVLFTSHATRHQRGRFPATTSPALPIQFMLTEAQSFGMTSTAGVSTRQLRFNAASLYDSKPLATLTTH